MTAYPHMAISNGHDPEAEASPLSDAPYHPGDDARHLHDFNAGVTRLAGVLATNTPLQASRRRSDNWHQLIRPLARAKAKFAAIQKTRSATESTKDPDSGVYTSRIYHYADLADCLSAVNAALGDEGLVISQSAVETPDMGWLLVTELLHESGAWLANYLPLPDLRAAAEPQEVAAALSLYRRYGLCPLLGIAAEETEQSARYVDKPKDTARPVRQVPITGSPTGRKAAAAPKVEAAAGVAAGEGAMQPQAGPQIPPDPSAPPDYTVAATRAQAVRALTQSWIELAKGGGEGWATAQVGLVDRADLIRALGATELEIVADQWRFRFGMEPPELDGVAWPAPAARA